MTKMKFDQTMFEDGISIDPNKKSKGFTTGRCYETHPPLKLPGDEGLIIYGGSCNKPSVMDADVYIGFDWGMKPGQRSWPWKKGHEFLFEITDMAAPSNQVEFDKLLEWTLKQLRAGQKVHCGCIGGHGRTGTFLAALSAKLGEKDAITYVRTNYCDRAVESTSQINFLHQHYGVTKTKGSKEGKYSGSVTSHSSTSTSAKRHQSFMPMKAAGSIWGTVVDCN